MARNILIFLLILCSFPAFSQSSSAPAKSCTHCFTDTEWAAFEEEVWAEEQTAIKEAVDEAVKPYIIEIKKQDRQLLIWKIGTGVSLAAALASLIWAALK